MAKVKVSVQDPAVEPADERRSSLLEATRRMMLASIGAVLSQPGEQAGALLRRADAAMFAVKRAHRRVRRTTRSSARQPVGQLTLLQDSVVQSSVTETAVRTG